MDKISKKQILHNILHDIAFGIFFVIFVPVILITSLIYERVSKEDIDWCNYD